MTIVVASKLEQLVKSIFVSVGSSGGEAQTIARHLVEANLVGHDSHGVQRVGQYVGWVQAGQVTPNVEIEVKKVGESQMLIDGKFGYGQVVGEKAVQTGIDAAHTHGLAMVGLRNCGHLGRIGDWAQMAADAGYISIHFVNSNGFSMLVAPFGGSDRRLGSNPIAIGIPREAGRHIILDMATAKVAEGKVQVAKNKGEELPEGIIIDANGNPTQDPQKLYDDPPGAILPLSPGHKGFGLSVMCEILAGALCGGGATRPDNPHATRFANGMLSIYIRPTEYTELNIFESEIQSFIDWVSASPPAKDSNGVIMPGESEYNTKKDRLINGIPLDETTLKNLVTVGKSLGVSRTILNNLA
jgi:uncharacterized oxidoreductase